MIKPDIIFDMDGTLSDTGRATEKAIKAIEERFHLPSITYNHIQDVMGIGGLDFYRGLFPNVPEDVIVALEPVVDALEDEAIRDLGTTILFPGVNEMLTTLKEAGYRLHIASTGSQNHVNVTLQAANIKHLFTTISCDQPEKISMVRNIIAGSDPGKWAMVGDMFKDSEAAKGNNILALGAGFGYLAKEDESLFDAIIKTPRDIWAYV